MSEEDKNLSAEQAGTEPEQSAENIPEEINPATESIFPEPETAVTGQPQNTTPKLKTQEMEVHHHGHVHEKKKWKEYVFQFFMLFLAVFCGFLAEYHLEHLIETQREKKYIQGLVQNLQSDTTSIRTAITSNLRKQAAFDSLLLLADVNLSLPGNSYKFYDYFIRGSFIPVFTPNDAGITQLINGGNLRLIGKKNVLDSILSYDAAKKQILQHNEIFSEQGDELWYAVYPIAHARVFNDTSYLDFSVNRKFKNKQPPSLTINAANLQLFFGQLSRTLLFTRVNRNAIIRHRSRAERLIALLKKEYHLE